MFDVTQHALLHRIRINSKAHFWMSINLVTWAQRRRNGRTAKVCSHCNWKLNCYKFDVKYFGGCECRTGNSFVRHVYARHDISYELLRPSLLRPDMVKGKLTMSSNIVILVWKACMKYLLPSWGSSCWAFKSFRGTNRCNNGVLYIYKYIVGRQYSTLATIKLISE